MSHPRPDATPDAAPVPASPQGMAHPYAFAHRMLPCTLFESPDWLFSTMQAEGDILLDWLWRKTPQHWNGVVEVMPTPALVWDVLQVDESLTLLWISLPEAQEPTDAHHVVMTRRVLPESASAPRATAYRYFTLERSVDLGWGEFPPKACEWTPEGEHRNYGEVAASDDLRGFLRWAAERALVNEAAFVVVAGDSEAAGCS